MNESNFLLAESIVSPSYIRQAKEARKQRENLVKTLLTQVMLVLFPQSD